MQIETPLSLKLLGQMERSSKKNGRPTIKTPEMIAAICEGISLGKSARAMCGEVGISLQTMWNWLDKDKGFVEQYARAKEQSADYHADLITEIADEENTTAMDSSEFNARQRLRIDARKWIACKLKPTRYGDKVAIGGADDLPPMKTISAALPPSDAYAAMLTGNVKVAKDESAEDFM